MLAPLRFYLRFRKFYCRKHKFVDPGCDANEKIGRRLSQERLYNPPQKLAVPRLIDLYSNPQETIQETIGESSLLTRAWVLHAMIGEFARLKATVAKDPLIPMGTLDPYVPPTGGEATFTVEVPTTETRD